ncbi:MAG: hypothetical protein ACYDCK_12720 [Thermoplasmatota archaeon]
MRGFRGWAFAALVVTLAFSSPLARADPTDPNCVVLTTGTDAAGLPTVTPVVGDSEVGVVVAGDFVISGLYLSIILHPSVCGSAPTSPPERPPIPPLP